MHTAKGRAMPINAAADPEGNITVFTDGGRLEPVLRFHSAANPPEPGVARYTSHFATCPDADRHRRSHA